MKKRNTLLATAVAALFAAPLALAAGGAGSAGAQSTTGAGTTGTTQGSAAAGAGQAGQTPQISAEMAFERLDENNDGFISRAEAGIAPDVIVIFPVADADKDEKLSRSEYDEGMKSRASAGGTAATGTGRPAGGAVIPGTAGRETEGGVDRMPPDRVGGERVGPGNLRPGKDEGDYNPQGQLGGDPLRSPPAASGSGGAGGAGAGR